MGLADTDGAAASGSTEALNHAVEAQASNCNKTLQEAQAIESAAEALSRATALSLKLDDFIGQLEKRSNAAIAALTGPDHAKGNNAGGTSTPPVSTKAGQINEAKPSDSADVAALSDADYPSPRMLPEVKECDWDHFVNRYSTDEDVYCVEVLVANSEVDIEVEAEFQKRRPPPKDDASKSNQIDTRPVRKIASDEKWIQRVRIQSNTLLKIFSKVTGYAWGNKPHTFVRPFQYLVYFHDRFKAELQQMEDALGDADLLSHTGGSTKASVSGVWLDGFENASAPSNTGGQIPTKVSNTTTEANETKVKAESQCGPGALSSDEGVAINELRCYIQFAEEKLLPHSQMFRTKNPSTRQKVRFSDLWYLFKPGDFVYLPNKTLGAFVEKQYDTYDRREAKWATNYTSWRGQNIWRLESLSLPEAESFPGAQKEEAHSIDSQILRAFYGVDDKKQGALLNVYYISFDGSSYGAIGREFKIEQFDGEKDILELDIYPLRYHPHSEKLLREATEQGRLCTKAVNRRHWFYDGWTFVSDPMGAFYSSDRRDRFLRSPEHIQGQVIIDFNETLNAVPIYKADFKESDQLRARHSFGSTSTSVCAINTWSDHERTKMVRSIADEVVLQDDCDLQEHDDYLVGDPYLRQSTRPKQIRNDREDDLALIPPWVYIYALQQRKFVPVDVRRLRPIDINNKAFEQLQLPDAHKAMIHAAVHSHLRRQRLERAIDSFVDGEVKGQDFIVGKGRGLLIMLHGAPGVGKTATAEAIAQQIAQPLFPVNCSDLEMSDSMDIESKIDEVFRLAHEWDCVLLMDEADVFLSARGSNGDNNTLVSIFLRKLEYYNGILFLTTNRIGKLDAAVASRLHLILHYKRLGVAEVHNIFRINIQRLQEAEEQQHKVSKEPKLFIVEDEILEFAEAHCAKYPNMRGAWNGRQIRNAFLVASSLARYEASKPGLLEAGFQPQLRKKHFEMVEDLNAKFWRLREALGSMDEATRARINEERDDYFEDEEQIAENINRQNPPSSRINIASLLQANRTRPSSPMQKQPSYGSVANGSQAGPAYPRQMHTSTYHQEQQHLQQPNINQWMGPNQSQGHAENSSLSFPGSTPLSSATMADSYHGSNQQRTGEAMQTYHRPKDGAHSTFLSLPNQQPPGVGSAWGYARGHDSGPVTTAHAQTGTDECM